MFQIRFLMKNLKNILKIIWGDGGSWEASAVLTEVGVGDLPFNHDDWLQNQRGNGTGSNQSAQNIPICIWEPRCWKWAHSIEKKNLDPYLTPYAKVNSKWILELNAKK